MKGQRRGGRLWLGTLVDQVTGDQDENTGRAGSFELHTLSSMQEPGAKEGCPDWIWELVGQVRRCERRGVRGH